MSILFKVSEGSRTASVDSPSCDLGSKKSLSVQASWDVTTPTAKAFISGLQEVQAFTFLDEASSSDGDYIVFEDSEGNRYALALSKNGKESQTLTFLAKASVVDRDFMIFYDSEGDAWALGLDKTGSSAEPLAQGWLDIPEARRAFVDISAASTAASVAAACEVALNALVGFSDLFTTDDTAANGTMLLNSDDFGPVSAPESYKGDAGTGFSSGLGTSVVGVRTTPGYFSEAPIGAAWAAVESDYKGFVEIDGLSTAIAIAEAAYEALIALPFFLDHMTAVDNEDGTIDVTQVEVGSTVNPLSYVFDDSGEGSITGSQTTAGTGGVNVVTNAVFSSAHGMATGLKVRLTTTDTDLPAPLAISTDYYVIAVDANHLKFATSLANAQAGTAINISDIGTGTHTITAEALSASTKLQRSNDGTNWVDVHDDEVLGGANSQTITADGSFMWILPDAPYNFIKQVLTIAGGQLTMSSVVCAK